MAFPGVAVDQNDNAVLAGWFAGTATIGDYEVVSAGQKDILVVKLDGTGAPVWVRRSGDAEEQWGGPVAIDPAGNPIVAGDGFALALPH
jgi:hypothetical protein